MDPESLITQVRGPQEEGTINKCDDFHDPLKNEAEITPHSDSPASNIGIDKETYAEPVSATKSRGRFLSQLLCCFGVGHAPDHADHELPDQVTYNGSCEQGNNHLLDPVDSAMADRICAVIDLDETLVHSSFTRSGDPDFIIEVEVDDVVHQIYVLKRPFADEFLEKMGQLFECVLFTASMGKYADPVCDLIDPNGALKHRLFRESCIIHCESYVKDLATLGRPVDRCVIIDNSPASFMFNAENGIQVQSWMGDPEDTELRDLLPYMEQLSKAASVSEHLRCNPPPLNSPPLTLEEVTAQMQQAVNDDF